MSPAARPGSDERGERHHAVQDRQVDGRAYYFEIPAAGNHETLATSETYKRPDKRDVLEAIDLIRTGVAGAEVVDDTDY